MKTIKLLFIFALSATLFTSCYKEEVVYYDNTPAASLNSLLNAYDLWYVDVNETVGYGETPFLQIAFTVSFRNGTMYANNNLVGFGSQGNGFGIPVADYDAYDMILDVYHDIDGYETFDVYQIDNNTIEFYNPFNNTSYFLHGYQRSNFDYDYIFYDNIHYFLQEYEAWEKTYTSAAGVVNEFDNENYLQFLSGGNDSEFKSSQDVNVYNPNNIYWDYTGVYGVGNIANNMYLKTLTLDYDYFNNENFQLSVLDDETISLYHSASGSTYEFSGQGYIQYMRVATENGRAITSSENVKKRKQKTEKTENTRTSNRG
ncbi:nicotinic acid mononucleotide adenyltransferase [Lacinutrix undariae]